MRKLDVVVVGGCGHVGLPLAIALADRGLRVVSYDINAETVASVAAGQMPFDEPGASSLLREVLDSGAFAASTDAHTVSHAETVIVVVGTPVDEHLNPDPQAVPDAISELTEHLRDGQLLVLRSTVYPGVTRLTEAIMGRSGKTLDIAFCPERIAEGRAFTELYDLPQIVSGCSPAAVKRASELFERLASKVIVVSPEEAELAKLFTNTWRYIKFAAANQFYMIANDYGIDFENVRHAITTDYPRAQDMPGAGFAAGPCLFKDTMQLAAFNNNNFMLGHSAMMVNEGLPLYLVARLGNRFNLAESTVGILGMAFKGESDDTRSSLSYKLRRILRFKSKAVLCHDPYVTTDPTLVPLDHVLANSDLLVIATPHRTYADLQTDLPVIDIWNLRQQGVAV